MLVCFHTCYYILSALTFRQNFLRVVLQNGRTKQFKISFKKYTNNITKSIFFLDVGAQLLWTYTTNRIIFRYTNMLTFKRYYVQYIMIFKKNILLDY